MRNRLQLAALLFCVCLCGCATTDSTVRGDASKDSGVAYIHPYSKFSFPKRIDNFWFVGALKYDRSGKDISVAYNNPTPVVATVYVYPAAKNFTLVPSAPLPGVSQNLIDHEFERRKTEILKIHPDAQLLVEGPCEIVQGHNRFKGKKAVYAMAYKFGLSNSNSISELYIFLIEPGTMFLVNERQYVEYRVTYPLNVQDLATNEVANFLSELTWPTK